MINRGWWWNGNKFHFSWRRFDSDGSDLESNIKRNTAEITKMMCSLVPFLKFTGEDTTMFQGGRLPTLDTALWVDGDIIKFSFYEKPSVGSARQVAQRQEGRVPLLPVVVYAVGLMQVTYLSST